MKCAPGCPAYVLVVDGELTARSSTCVLLKGEGYQTLEADTARSALIMIERRLPDMVLLDAQLPDMDGIKALREIRHLFPAIPVILFTLSGCINDAVNAVKCGAYHYMTKPICGQELLLAVRAAIASSIRAALPTAGGVERSALQDMMGSSASIRRLMANIDRVAPTDFTVIISGETGSGKELVAREIHWRSRRTAGPFIPVDCGAVQPSLIESELYGHVKGAFTGADRDRAGKFVAASRGTLFLDEVQNLPPAVQANLLRALQERQVCPVGASRCVDFDIRVIAATNQDLPALVAASRFRDDLFHRLNEFTIAVPSLSERPEDIVFLARRFISLTSDELGKQPPTLTSEAMSALLGYPWPGNVRELRNTVRRAVLLADAHIRAEHLGSAGGWLAASKDPADLIADENGLTAGLKSLVRKSVIQTEREILMRVLKQTRGNKAQAARLLQVDYKTIRTKARQYGITFLLDEENHHVQEALQ